MASNYNVILPSTVGMLDTNTSIIEHLEISKVLENILNNDYVPVFYIDVIRRIDNNVVVKIIRTITRY